MTNKTVEGDESIDMVNHPPHYQNGPKCPSCGTTIECIVITRAQNFVIGNAMKYLWRYKYKNGKECLKKAIWYIQDEIDNG